MNIEEMQKEENFEHEVLDRLKCLDPRDFDYNAVDGSYVDAVLKARDIILTAYEKEKERNKKSEEKIKKYINKIQKELDKYKIKNTNTYIQIEGNPEINGLLIQKATLEELIKEE